jgi:hypothetical protein
MSNFHEQLSDACHDYEAALWETARDDVVSLAACGPNWDGEEALPVRPGLIEATLRFLRFAELRQYPPPSDVYLAPDGTPIVEWHFPGGCATIANVRVREWAEVTYRTNGRPPQFDKVRIPSFPDLGTAGAVDAPHSPTCAPIGPTSYLDDEVYSLAA